MAEIHGVCDERFGPLREAFEAQLASGDDVGASVAVYIEGEPVVDLWGGTNWDGSAPWEKDTIINVFSTTKTMTFVCALLLADRGELDLSAPVSRYWPEYAANGKEGALVRHILGHCTGTPGWSQPITTEDVYDWEKVTTLLAEQEPWWEPGTLPAYHALAQGFLIGEVVRRITGKTIGRFFAEEVAGPLGADFFIGTPPEADGQVDFLIPAPPQPPPEGVGSTSPFIRVLGNPLVDVLSTRTQEWRRAEIPAGGGHGNARSVGAVQSVISNHGEARGVRLLSPEICQRIFETQSHGTDKVLMLPVRYGMGYGLVGDEFPIAPNKQTCFWGGYGGSRVMNDLDARMTIAYVMNKMVYGVLGDVRAYRLCSAAYESIGQPFTAVPPSLRAAA